MQQTKFSPEESAAIKQFSNFLNGLGIPFDLSMEDPDIHVEMKTPSFEYSVHPGYIIKCEIKGEYHFAIALTPSRSIYMDKTGQVKGYLASPTQDNPYKVVEVRRPTSEYFKLSDFDNMELMWKRPADKVKKSIADIEKELGLTPGTLEIL